MWLQTKLHHTILSTHIVHFVRLLWSQMPRPEESDSEDEDGPDGDEYGEGNNLFSADVEATGAREVLSFTRVVGDMVSTGISEGHPASSLLMEIKGYKFAQNKVCCIHSVLFLC